MKKKALLVFIAFTLTLFFTFVLYNMHASDLVNAPALARAFDGSGANIVSSECYVWCRLDRNFCMNYGIEKVADIIAGRLGVLRDESFSKTSEEDDNISRVEINAALEDGRSVRLGVQADRKPSGGAVFTGTISLTEQNGRSLLKASAEKALNALRGLADKTDVNFSITGSFDSEIEKDSWAEIAQRMFAMVNAREVSRIEDGNLVSISAYSPHFVNHVEVEGKKMNLNLAMRNNLHEGKTYIWLATPVITTEY